MSYYNYIKSDQISNNNNGKRVQALQDSNTAELRHINEKQNNHNSDKINQLAR